MSSWNPDLVVKAWRFSASHHHGQGVPGTEGWSAEEGKVSYLYHLGLVSSETMCALSVEDVSSPDLAVACAILHDSVEDTAADYELVSREFGQAVADGVQALSKDGALPKAERLADSLARIKRQPLEVWMVKLADRVTNLQPPPPHWSREKCLGYRDDAQLILNALGEASPYLANRLEEKIASYRIPA